MSTDVTVFGAALIISLAFLSLLIRMRMRGFGRPSRAIWAAVGELWLTFGAIAAVLWSASRLLGEPAAGDAVSELSDIGARFGALDARAKVWVVVGGAFAVLLFVRLVALLRRYMEEPANDGG